jgi:hypothetical protein
MDSQPFPIDKHRKQQNQRFERGRSSQKKNLPYGRALSPDRFKDFWR